MAVARRPSRYEIWLVTLNPAVGSEMRKTRPAVVVSPDEVNAHLTTVIIAPMTTSIRNWSFRVDVNFEGTMGQIATDQLRAVDISRCVKRLGRIETPVIAELQNVLAGLFAP